MYRIGGKVISGAFTHPETGVKYPPNWLRLTTPAERAAIGVIEEPDPVPPEPTIEEAQAASLTAIKAQATMELAKTDWRILRALERALKAELLAEEQTLADAREALRVASDAAEADVLLCKSAAEVKALGTPDLALAAEALLVGEAGE